MTNDNNYPSFGGGQFYPDTPRKAFKEILNQTYLLHEAKILKDLETQFGKHDAAVFLLETLGDKKKFTTISSSSIVLRQTTELLEANRFPIYITPSQRQGRQGKYYTLG